MHNLIAAFKIFLFLLNCIWVIPAQSVMLFITKGHGKAAYILPKIWHAIVSFIFGIKITWVGSPDDRQQTVFISNHISYLDIPALGGKILASFVAKSEVAGWGGFGYLSTLQQTAFLNRQRSAVKKEAGNLQTMLEDGKSLIIFAEATSTDGTQVEPFKSSLFSLFYDGGFDHIQIQPVSIRLDTVNRQAPQSYNERIIYAWPRELDMEMPEHLWRFANSKGSQLTITFHEPIHAKDHENRKTLAKTCHNIVSKGIEKNASLTPKEE